MGQCVNGAMGQGGREAVTGRGSKGISSWAGGLVAALLVAGLLSPWASPLPDGLERVAETLGFRDQERSQPILAAPFREYRVAAVPDERWSTALAGIAGTLAVFGAASLAGYLIRRRKA